ncbi:hypothetical protein ABC733_05100 [Mangrovibacter sp. SLW1]
MNNEESVMTRYEQLYAFLREHPASDAQAINHALGTSGKVIYYEIKKGCNQGNSGAENCRALPLFN